MGLPVACPFKTFLKDSTLFRGINHAEVNILGTKVAVRIAELGLKKGDIAKLAGINRGTLSLIVKGESIPSLPVALKIARILETTVEILWGDLIE